MDRSQRKQPRWFIGMSLLCLACGVSAQPVDEAPHQTRAHQDVLTPKQTTAAPTAPRMATAAASSTAGVAVGYAYDSLGRLIQEAYPANASDYTYDAAGNRTQAHTR